MSRQLHSFTISFAKLIMKCGYSYTDRMIKHRLALQKKKKSSTNPQSVFQTLRKMTTNLLFFCFKLKNYPLLAVK